MRNIVTVITGGHGGMGSAAAKELGEDSILVLASREEATLNRTKSEMDDLGYDCRIFPMDVRSKEETEALAAYAAALGDIERVIHTGGVSPTDSDARTVLETNAIGTVHVTNAFYPRLAEGGVQINFASLAAYTMEAPDEWYEAFDECESPELFAKLVELTAPFSGDAFTSAGIAYCISKRFVIYYSQKNTVRYANKGCRILSISPGSYMTPMHQKLLDNQPETARMQLESIPFRRWGKAYEIAGLVRFLCSPAAGFLSGTDILTDGGQTANTFVSQLD